MKTHHLIFLAIAAMAAIALIFFGVKADRLIRIGAGYKAKIACSEIFLANRDSKLVLKNEFAGMDPILQQIKVAANIEKQETKAAGPLGLGRAKAVYRDGYGCALANSGRVRPTPALPKVTAQPWAEAPAISGKAINRVDYAAIDFALTNAFDNNTAAHRSLLVAVDGKIVDERYGEGFTEETPFLSWSMAKSITATLIGAAVEQGLIDINEPAPVPEWAGDKSRANITWHDLLQMQSGLEFSEEYGDPRSDVNRMLFELADAGAFAANKPAAYKPGEHWYYSSGTSNLLSRTLRQTLEAKGIDYHAFSQDALLTPIGAGATTIETDASGSFIGSSFIYATARDWARLGQLYLQDGVWNGERLLPEGWSDYVAAPAAMSDNQYGAHFWLNRDGKDRERFIPGLPEEVYYMAGHEGQYVIIIPSKKMVIVRTGITRGANPIELVAPVVKEIYDGVGKPEGA